MPPDPILALYDRGIAGCLARDARAVKAVLLELIAAVNFEFDEAAAGFCRLYEDQLRRVGRGDFEATLLALRTLRASCVASGSG